MLSILLSAICITLGLLRSFRPFLEEYCPQASCNLTHARPRQASVSSGSLPDPALEPRTHPSPLCKGKLRLGVKLCAIEHDFKGAKVRAECSLCCCQSVIGLLGGDAVRDGGLFVACGQHVHGADSERSFWAPPICVHPPSHHSVRRGSTAYRDSRCSNQGKFGNLVTSVTLSWMRWS